MNTPDDRNRRLADALADLADAADRVAAVAKDLRGDLQMTDGTPGTDGTTAAAADATGAAPGDSDAVADPASARGAESRPEWSLPPMPPGPQRQHPLARSRTAGPAPGQPMPTPTPQQPVAGQPPQQPPLQPSAPQPPQQPSPLGPQQPSPLGPQQSLRPQRFFQPQQPQQPQQPPTPFAARPPELITPRRQTRDHPWWEDEKIVLRVTAGVGAFITVSGIILLVAFAIQSGLLGPLGRVILAYALATVLAVTAVVVHRKDPDNAGVTAAGSAAVITAHVTTATLVQGLEWWPNWLGTLVLLGVMGLGFLAARVWNSVAFLMVGFVVTYLAAFVTVWPRSDDADPYAVLPALLIPSLVVAWVWRDRPKRSMVSKNAAGFYLVGSIVVLDSTEPGWLGAAAFIAIGIAIAVPEFLDDTVIEGHTLVTPSAGADPAAPAPHATTPGSTGLQLATLYALAWPTVIILSIVGPGEKFSLTVALLLGLAIGAAGFGPWKDRSDPRMNTLRWAGFITAAWPALHLGIVDNHETWTRLPALLVAAAFVWTYVFRRSTLGRRLMPLWVAVALLCNGPALVLTMFAPSYLIEHRFQLGVLDAPNVVLSALLLGVIALGLIAITVAHREHAGNYEKTAGLVGLLLTAVPVIITLTSAGVRFSLAHVLLSIGWMVAAAWLMLAPKRLNVDANMAASLVIAGVAVIKLVFYDMQAMTGLTRVSAFLLCGLVMLGMVVARSLRDKKADRADRDARPVDVEPADR
ncbi:DUF2339 domain-containing protein [Corynebacterium freneyi]|uniref:DUF2339 domain-containing protein n=1 Tax=Corynebacterium freneyi TaxID=134034 RepID=A0ABS4U6S4_9CORY|nr:DUF2339 domain-containing protein [Corynebacterium freneyi]MBP2332358.1 hypothetical protein [Corynebacterium freneyi]QXA53439.1 DUF2339 domain-containing protein [Corynebacterium freneyi]WJZ05534.1 hypothetical protein CFREN_07860 [Corynebacterium freneyi]